MLPARFTGTTSSGIEEAAAALTFSPPSSPRTGSPSWSAPPTCPLRPVHDLLRRDVLARRLAGRRHDVRRRRCSASFYRRQLLSSLRIEREQIFNEKILANMPVGIALVDPAGERFLQVNSTFVGDRPLPGPPAARGRCVHGDVRATWPSPAARRWRACCTSACPSRPSNSARATASRTRAFPDDQPPAPPGQPAAHPRRALPGRGYHGGRHAAPGTHQRQHRQGPVPRPAQPRVAQPALARHHDGGRAGSLHRRAARHAPAAGDHPPQRRTGSPAHRRPARRDAHLQRQAATQPPGRSMSTARCALALEICQREIDDKGLRLELELRARDHYAVADPARLQQMFWNLLKNAVKFTPEGRRIVVRSSNYTAAPVSAASGGPEHDRDARCLYQDARDRRQTGGERRACRHRQARRGRWDFCAIEVVRRGHRHRAAAFAANLQRVRPGAEFHHAAFRRAGAGAGDFQGDGRGARRQSDGVAARARARGRRSRSNWTPAPRRWPKRGPSRRGPDGAGGRLAATRPLPRRFRPTARRRGSDGRTGSARAAGGRPPGHLPGDAATAQAARLPGGGGAFGGRRPGAGDG